MAQFRNKKRKPFVKPIIKKQSTMDHVTEVKISKSFVFCRGKLPGILRQLQMDLRKLMLPCIALKLKNIFQAIDINTVSLQASDLKLITIDRVSCLTITAFQVKLSLCQRILLLNYNKDTKLIDFQHYSIILQPVEVSRRLRKFV